MSTPQQITDNELKRYTYGVQLSKIMSNVVSSDKSQPRKIASPFSEEMIKDYKDELNKPVIVEGKEYKYHPASTIPELISDADEAEFVTETYDRINGFRAHFINASAQKTEYIRRIPEIEDEIRVMNREINSGAHSPNDVKVLRQGIAAKKIILVNLRKRIQTLDDTLRNLMIAEEQDSILLDQGKVEKDLIAKENKEKIKNYVDELNMLNSGQFSTVQQPNETEAEFLDRLNETAQQPVNNYYLEQDAIIENMKKFKSNMKELIKSDIMIESVMRSLTSEEVFEVNKLFGLIKERFLKKYGFNNTTIRLEEIKDFLIESSNPEMIKIEPNIAVPVEPKVEVLGRKQESTPIYVEFGDILIRYSDLMKKNVLAIRNKHKNKIPQYGDAPVSEDLKELINSLIQGKNPSSAQIKALGNEKELYDKLIYKSGLGESVKHSVQDTIKQLKKDADIILGEIDSGNDNHQLLINLHHILNDLKKFKVIDDKELKEKMAEATKVLYSAK